MVDPFLGIDLSINLKKLKFNDFFLILKLIVKNLYPEVNFFLNFK